MQQQIQQHQRQLAQALLMKQQPPPPHLSLHPSAGKSAMDSFSPHPQAPGLPDLQTKEQQSSPNTFAPYPLGKRPSLKRFHVKRTEGVYFIISASKYFALQYNKYRNTKYVFIK